MRLLLLCSIIILGMAASNEISNPAAFTMVKQTKKNPTQLQHGGNTCPSSRNAARVLPLHRSPVVLSSSSSSSTASSTCEQLTVSRDGLFKKAIVGGGVLLGCSSGIASVNARIEPLGVIDELLADCSRRENACASSQDDRPAVWQEPWQYDSSLEKTLARLKRYIQSLPGSEVISEEERYLRVEFHEGKEVDDTEFYFTPNDVIIQFRSARRGTNGDRGANLKRMEKIRIALGFEKVPVLRNRRRAFLLFESKYDSFGPTYGSDAPPPAELDQVYSDIDPMSPIWERPSPYPRKPKVQPGGRAAPGS